MDEIHLVGDTFPVGTSQWPEIYIQHFTQIQGSCSLLKASPYSASVQHCSQSCSYPKCDCSGNNFVYIAVMVSIKLALIHVTLVL